MFSDYGSFSVVARCSFFFRCSRLMECLFCCCCCCRCCWCWALFFLLFLVVALQNRWKVFGCQHAQILIRGDTCTNDSCEFYSQLINSFGIATATFFLFPSLVWSVSSPPISMQHRQLSVVIVDVVVECRVNIGCISLCERPFSSHFRLQYN